MRFPSHPPTPPPRAGTAHTVDAMPRTIDALIAQIEEHRHTLDATAAEAERLGEAPESLVDILRALRVPLVKAPVEAGGDGLTLAEQMRYFAALSYHDSTAGWVGFNHAGAASAAAARLPDAGFEEVFGADPCPFFAAVATPGGRFRRTPHGAVVSGVWKFASGCLHADWALVVAVGDADSPGVRSVVMPMRDLRREGEWNVMALKGTGSIDLVCEDVSVPDRRLLDPTAGPLRGGPQFSLPYMVYVAGGNLGFTLGVAERFLDEATAYARTKSRGFGGTLGTRGAFRHETGQGTHAGRQRARPGPRDPGRDLVPVPGQRPADPGGGESGDGHHRVRHRGLRRRGLPSLPLPRRLGDPRRLRPPALFS